jgi:hypothetical protein
MELGTGGGNIHTFIGCSWHALHDGPPVHQLVVIDGSQLQQCFVGIGLVCLELGEQALHGRRVP